MAAKRKVESGKGQRHLNAPKQVSKVDKGMFIGFHDIDDEEMRKDLVMIINMRRQKKCREMHQQYIFRCSLLIEK